MHSVAKAMVDFLKNEDGPTAVEYAVMLALIIVVVCITDTVTSLWHQSPGILSVLFGTPGR